LLMMAQPLHDKTTQACFARPGAGRNFNREGGESIWQR
jgi:hypothetical protein